MEGVGARKRIEGNEGCHSGIAIARLVWHGRRDRHGNSKADQGVQLGRL